MFNKDLKERYIKEKSETATIPNNYLVCQFDKSQKLETEFNKDISNFTVSEISEYYKTLNVGTLESLIVMNSHFSLYTQWCMQENLVRDGQNHFLEMDYDALKRCLNNVKFNMKIVDRNIIVNWCEQLPNPKDQVVLLGLFEGLKGKDFVDLTNLKPEDVDFEKCVIHLSNRDLTVSERLIQYIKDAIEENTYYSISGEGIAFTTLVDKGYVIKDYPNTKDNVSQFQKGRKIYNGVKRSLKYVGADYTSANGINESGKIYFIKEKAKELNISPIDYIYSNSFKELEQRFDCKIVKSIYIKKYEGCL